MNPKNISSAILFLLGLLNTLFPLANIEAAVAAEGVIAFRSTRDSKPPNRGISTAIYLINADGTNERKWLENKRCGFSPPTWSPDGRKIAYSTCRRNAGFHVFVKNLRNGIQKKVTDKWEGDHLGYVTPSWSGDGKSLALSCWELPPLEASDICIVDVEGKRLKNLTRLAGVEDSGPSWSPDSSKIAFMSNRDGNSEIYVMDADGRNPVNLTNHSRRDAAPDWSPDGKRIVFYSDREEQSDIYTVDPDGANLVKLTDHPAQDRVPSWSPDGRWIAFQSTRDGNWEIYVMDVTENNQTRITNHPFAVDIKPVSRVTNHPDTDGSPVWVIPNRSLPADARGNHVTLWGRLKSEKQ